MGGGGVESADMIGSVGRTFESNRNRLVESLQHDARAVVSPELAKVPEQHILAFKVPPIHKWQLHARR